MNNQAKQYRPLAIVLATAFGVLSGLLLAGVRFKSPKPPKGG